jgi:hypothetical protein
VAGFRRVNRRQPRHGGLLELHQQQVQHARDDVLRLAVDQHAVERHLLGLPVMDELEPDLALGAARGSA